MNHTLVKGALLPVLIVGLSAAARPLPSLSRYVGKYPTDKVAGISLYNHPRFRALVNAAAPSNMVAATILAPAVENRVERQGALIVAEMCEAHDCIDRQWTVAILSPNGPAAVCYYDSNLMGGGRWFVGVNLIAQTRLCWEGEHTNVPDAVFMRLARGR